MKEIEAAVWHDAIVPREFAHEVDGVTRSLWMGAYCYSGGMLYVYGLRFSEPLPSMAQDMPEAHIVRIAGGYPDHICRTVGRVLKGSRVWYHLEGKNFNDPTIWFGDRGGLAILSRRSKGGWFAIPFRRRKVLRMVTRIVSQHPAYGYRIHHTVAPPLECIKYMLLDSRVQREVMVALGFIPLLDGDILCGDKIV